MWRKNENKICEIGKSFDWNCANVNNFQPLEVVDRVSETQLQAGENLNYIILHIKE